MPMPTMQQVNASSSNNNSRFQDKMLDSDYLFSPERIKKLNWDNHCASYDPEISPLQPGDGLLVRPLHIDDFQKGRFRSMQKCSNTYFIAVVEDLHKRAVVASCTLVVEQKFIHDAGQRGRIEDVVVGNEYRGKQLGKLYGNVVKQLVDAFTVFARELGCYKISLECKDKLVGFYETFGFRKDAGNNFMISRI